MTAERLRATDEDGRLLLLASRDGVDAGCAIGALSGWAGLAFFGVRVLPEHRGRGVARELTRALCDHARALGRDGVNASVDAAEPEAKQVAEHYGLQQVDYELRQERTVGDEPASPLAVVSLVGRREELLHAAWPLAQEAYADLPLPGEVSYPLATWLRDEATLPDGSFVALDGDAVVGYAGLSEHEPGKAEHGLTAVARTHRGRGIGRGLKLAQLHWAAGNGIHTLVTWTQQGNEAMQALNRSLGYEDVSKVLTMQGPLPL